MTDGRAIAYSEREHEFTFAKNDGYVERHIYQITADLRTYS